VIRTKRLEKYIYDFFSARIENYKWFYKTVNENKKNEIYTLKYGIELMDFLGNVQSNIEEIYFSKNLIPQQFATPDSLLKSLQNFKNYLNKHQKYIDASLNDKGTYFIISRMLGIKIELIEMINYCQEVYDYEEATVPYQNLRLNLIQKNIEDFIQNLKSILASVSYSINKTKEGYYHSNVHLILKLLGFDIISEEETNIGRIDAVIKFTNVIYIVEFKFDNENDTSKKALNQIKENNYYEKYISENKEIIAIGIGFSDKERNICGYSSELLR
jgi:hypothetical protein